MNTEEQLIDSWRIQSRINLYLLDSIPEEHLKDQLSSKGRNVGEQFAHIHNVRLMWLKVSAPELVADQVKLEKETGFSKGMLRDALEGSSVAMEKLLAKGMAEGRIKNFKPHPVAFFGYFIAHEAHHRSAIVLGLKQSGHPIDKKTGYGIWEWGSR